MKVEMRPVAELTPYANNPYSHSSQQMELLKRSIIRFGITQPLVIDPDGQIIIGHARLRAAKELDIKQVPCVVVDQDSDRIRALRIADNKTQEMSEWDIRALTEELEGLDGELVFFDDQELEAMGVATDDVAAEHAPPSAKAITCRILFPDHGSIDQLKQQIGPVESIDDHIIGAVIAYAEAQ